VNQYRVYQDKEIKGPFELKELVALPGFSADSQVCEVGDDVWQLAGQVRAIRSHLSPETTNLNDWKEHTSSPKTLNRYEPKPIKAIRLSGDFISPNHQFGAPRRLSHATRRKSGPVPLRKVRVIDLPQPRPSIAFGRVFLISLLLLGGSGYWAFRTSPPFRTSVFAQYRQFQKINLVEETLAVLRQAGVIAPQPTHPRKK